MRLRLATTASLRVQGRIKLARVLEMPEREFEERVRELETDGLFRRLLETGVLRIQPYSQARFFARRFDGRELRVSNEGLPELLDGKGDLAKLIAGIGRQRFEDFFLKDETLSDEERATRSGIAVRDARRLREFIDRLYVQSEFESPAAQPVPSVAFSAVAGIELQDGRPVLGFFNREIWKGRYRVDESRRAALQASLPPAETRRLDRLVQKAELLNRRKTTLYRVLVMLTEAQAEYLATGDLERRRPLTQRAVAARLSVATSVLNRVIANKSIETPWGMEIPMKALLPSKKKLMRDQLYNLALENPESSDGALRAELGRRCGAKLSSRSITQYRKELGLGVAGQRGPVLRPGGAVAA